MSKVYPATSLVGGVTGSLDSIDGTDLADKDVAIVTVQDGNMYPYVLDADSAETEASPYIISPDTNAGDKRWKLVGVQGAMSHVRANRSTAQSIPNNTSSKFIWNTEVLDTLGEYNPTTGEFTATYDGLYHVNATIMMASSAWPLNQTCYIIAMIDGSGDNAFWGPAQAAATYYLSYNLNSTIELSATEVLTIEIIHNQGGAVNSNANVNFNHLTIDRLI